MRNITSKKHKNIRNITSIILISFPSYYNMYVNRGGCMAKIEELQILKNLQEQNPWWTTGKVREDLIPSFKRSEYKRISFIFFNKLRRFPILSGARRVGKSTLMFQMIDELLNSGIKPNQILFYTFDDFPNDEVNVQDVLRIYQKFVYSEDSFYFFIDEAQKDKTWKSTVKKIFDLNKQARVMISGSSSVEIEKNSDESGAARFLTIKIPTLSFYDFCELNGKHVDIDDIDVFKVYKLPLEQQALLFAKIAPLYREFIRYLKIGGFPEYSNSDQYSYISRLIRDQVVTKAIRQDIPSSYQIRDIDALSNLYAYFCYHTSDIANIETIANALKIDRETVNQYINALEKANLIYISEQLDIGGKKVLKPRKKIYVSDYGIRCAVTRDNDVETNETELGLAIETVSLKHTKDYFNSLDEELYTVGYSRGDNNKEIDIVVKEQSKEIQFIEAKYRNKSHIKDTDGIIVYGLKDTPGYVVTKEIDDFGLSKRGDTSLYRIPAVVYFYLLGKGIK